MCETGPSGWSETDVAGLTFVDPILALVSRPVYKPLVRAVYYVPEILMHRYSAAEGLH